MTATKTQAEAAAASEVPFAPAAGVTATDVQAAIEELANSIASLPAAATKLFLYANFR